MHFYVFRHEKWSVKFFLNLMELPLDSINDFKTKDFNLCNRLASYHIMYPIFAKN